jgi:hypothetical protein
MLSKYHATPRADIIQSPKSIIYIISVGYIFHPIQPDLHRRDHKVNFSGRGVTALTLG